MRLKYYDCLFSIEILLDESIKRTFSVISFMRNYHTVQKVVEKEVIYLYNSTFLYKSTRLYARKGRFRFYQWYYVTNQCQGIYSN